MWTCVHVCVYVCVHEQSACVSGEPQYAVYYVCMIFCVCVVCVLCVNWPACIAIDLCDPPLVLIWENPTVNQVFSFPSPLYHTHTHTCWPYKSCVAFIPQSVLAFISAIWSYEKQMSLTLKVFKDQMNLKRCINTFIKAYVYKWIWYKRFR